MSNSKDWISFHIFFKDERNAFLQKAVVPLIEQLKTASVIRDFFYIRYNQEGPHIRIRFLCQEVMKEALSEMINAVCKNYFGARFFELREVVYRPETERYGGSATLPLAEAHFALSSKVCLAVLSEQPDNILSRAMILHFSMMAVSALSMGEIHELCDTYLENWFSHSGLIQDGITPRQAAIKHFEPEYQKMPQKDLFKKIYYLIDTNDETGISWLDTWIEGNKSTLSDLFKAAGDPSKFQRILESLIHMTNNRLGVKNYDEAFLAYLLKRTIEDEFTPESEATEKP